MFVFLFFFLQNAERSERYDEMCRFSREILKICISEKKEPTEEEKNSFHLGYKNVFHSLRSSWKIIAKLNLSTQQAQQLHQGVQPVPQEALHGKHRGKKKNTTEACLIVFNQML